MMMKGVVAVPTESSVWPVVLMRPKAIQLMDKLASVPPGGFASVVGYRDLEGDVKDLRCRFGISYRSYVARKRNIVEDMEVRNVHDTLHEFGVAPGSLTTATFAKAKTAMLKSMDNYLAGEEGKRLSPQKSPPTTVELGHGAHGLLYTDGHSVMRYEWEHEDGSTELLPLVHRVLVGVLDSTTQPRQPSPRSKPLSIMKIAIDHEVRNQLKYQYGKLVLEDNYETLRP